MFSRKQIATASGLLGGLVMACASGAQAYAAGPASTCPVDSQGNTTCIQRAVGTPDGHGFVVRNDKCVPVRPVTWPGIPILNSGWTRIGPEVTCDPRTTAAPDDDENALERLLG